MSIEDDQHANFARISTYICTVELFFAQALVHLVVDTAEPHSSCLPGRGLVRNVLAKLTGQAFSIVGGLT